MLKNSAAVAFSLLAVAALALTACVSSPEQQARNDANAAREAASKKVVLQACYPMSDSELGNAQTIARAQPGYGDAVYWFWRASYGSPTLASVNAQSSVDLNPSCLNQITTTCRNLGLEPSVGSVSRRQAINGQGEFTITCAPRLEQS